MIAVTGIDMTGFNRGIAGLIDRIGIDAKKVVKKETGELMKTLVRVSPPKSVSKTKQGIERRVTAKFDAARDTGGHPSSGSAMEWYAFSSKFLYGVAEDNDKRNASTDELYKLSFKITKTGRQLLDFVHPRQRQRVLLSGRILTEPDKVKDVVKRIQNHVGRLKAGWLAAWDFIQPTGGNNPPEYIMKHKQGAKGRFENGLNTVNFPTFTIANSAKGITDKKIKSIIQFALNLRGRAMASNIRLLFAGKKRLSTYA